MLSPQLKHTQNVIGADNTHTHSAQSMRSRSREAPTSHTQTLSVPNPYTQTLPHARSKKKNIGEKQGQVVGAVLPLRPAGHTRAQKVQHSTAVTVSGRRQTGQRHWRGNATRRTSPHTHNAMGERRATATHLHHGCLAVGFLHDGSTQHARDEGESVQLTHSSGVVDRLSLHDARTGADTDTQGVRALPAAPPRRQVPGRAW